MPAARARLLRYFMICIIYWHWTPMDTLQLVPRGCPVASWLQVLNTREIVHMIHISHPCVHEGHLEVILCDMGCLSQELKEGRQHAATLERQMHELEASSGASQVQAAELTGLRDRVTTLTTQLKVGRSRLHLTGFSLKLKSLWMSAT